MNSFQAEDIQMQLIERNRVNKIMENIFDYPLTIINAPIGYGKTIALNQFLQNCNSLSILFTVSIIDDNPDVFWTRITKQIRLHNKSLGERLQSLGFPKDDPQLVKVLELIIHLKTAEKTVIVLDDYYLIKSPLIFKLIEAIAQEDVYNLHIVLLTRNIANLNIYNLVFRRLCLIINHEILAFDKEEIKLLLSENGLNDNKTQDLYEYTEGWVSLIYLEVLGVKKGLQIGMTKTIDKLIEKNLYNAYDEDLKQFLLKLSIFDNFTKEQVMYVLEEPNSYNMLLKLSKDNAFIHFDDSKNVYSIHQVFLDFLRFKRETITFNFKPLTKRVGKWFIKQGEFPLALTYYHRAKDIEGMLKEINNRNEITLIYINQEYIFKAFDHLPQELWLKYPLAYLKYLRVNLLSGINKRVQNGLKKLDELQEIYERNLKNGHADSEIKRILGEVQVIRVFISFNDVYKMVEYEEKAYALLGDQKSALVVQDIDNYFGFPFMLYNFFREQGKLEKVTNYVIRNFDTANRVFKGCSIASSYLFLAEYALEIVDINTAKINVYKAKYQAILDDRMFLLISAQFTLARLLLLQGKSEEVKQVIQEIKEFAKEKNNASLNTMVDICIGYIYGCLRLCNHIPDWLKSDEVISITSLQREMTFHYIVQGKAILLSGNFRQLDKYCKISQKCMEKSHNQLGILHNCIYQAIAMKNIYGKCQGMKALISALAIGQADRIILPFAENAPYIYDLLKEIGNEQTEIQRDYIQEVIKTCNQYLEHLSKLKISSVSLTAREKEVMYLIAEGLKRKEVAQNMNISIATVNKMLEHIYKKLAVSNKTSAIKKAKDLNII
ncbi:helix-turn-helix transcriptional regulator [Bacillus massiliigorillae]|uniref:helix-turn-helix transcriptional regulator n=1 Tax=Bacillus massiliigorillae TaxID=1243664 RepID=UPI00039BCD62|nr:LuxR C-terminal-related transcriptional regulator [Bacillus massiliigorillae]